MRDYESRADRSAFASASTKGGETEEHQPHTSEYRHTSTWSECQRIGAQGSRTNGNLRFPVIDALECRGWCQGSRKCAQHTNYHDVAVAEESWRGEVFWMREDIAVVKLITTLQVFFIANNHELNGGLFCYIAPGFRY